MNAESMTKEEQMQFVMRLQHEVQNGRKPTPDELRIGYAIMRANRRSAAPAAKGKSRKVDVSALESLLQ